MTTAMQKAPELEEDKVAALAHIMQHNKLAATKPDYRFPNQNQVNNCWQTVNEYQVCVEQRSKEDATCLQRARDYQSVCPAKWIEVRYHFSLFSLFLSGEDEYAVLTWG